MDWRLSSLGLVLDGMSFLSPLGLPTLGIPWYSYQSFAVQAFLVLVGLFLTLLGLIKRGSISVSSSEVLMLACGFSCFLHYSSSAQQLWPQRPSGIVAPKLVTP